MSVRVPQCDCTKFLTITNACKYKIRTINISKIIKLCSNDSLNLIQEGHKRGCLTLDSSQHTFQSCRRHESPQNDIENTLDNVKLFTMARSFSLKSRMAEAGMFRVSNILFAGGKSASIGFYVYYTESENIMATNCRCERIISGDNILVWSNAIFKLLTFESTSVYLSVKPN